MTAKQVTVTKYVSCDDVEFDSCDECAAHEREVRNLLEHNVYESRCKKRELLYAINEARINARIAWLDAQRMKPVARSAKVKSEYCKRMSEYWHLASEYNIKRRQLFELRRSVSISTDNLYLWFGLHKKKANIARLERMGRSARWRQEHTPDQWRTPHKIRVSPHPARGED